MDKDDDFIISGSSDITLDISNQGAACETLTIGEIDISDLTMNSGSSNNFGVYTIDTTNGSYDFSNVSYNLGPISPSPSSVNITNSGIEMSPTSDIKIGERSLKEFMDTMEKRLAILVPDPNKLEKFEALKKAYEHYKTMESLCFDEPKEDEK